jgi:hypothetical protein
MRTLTLGLVVSYLVWAASACQGDRDDEEPASASPASRLIPQSLIGSCVGRFT